MSDKTLELFARPESPAYPMFMELDKYVKSLGKKIKSIDPFYFSSVKDGPNLTLDVNIYYISLTVRFYPTLSSSHTSITTAFFDNLDGVLDVIYAPIGAHDELLNEDLYVQNYQWENFMFKGITKQSCDYIIVGYKILVA